MKEFHWTLADVLDLPIPAFFRLLDMLSKDYKHNSRGK